MPVTVTTHLPGATPEMYEQINRELGMSEHELPDGLIAHYASQTDDGLRIFDVWESREQFEELLARIGPAMEKVAGGQAPQVEPEFGRLQNVFARK